MEYLLKLLTQAVADAASSGIQKTKEKLTDAAVSKLQDLLLTDGRLQAAIVEMQRDGSLESADEDRIRRALDTHFSLEMRDNRGVIQQHSGTGDNNATISNKE